MGTGKKFSMGSCVAFLYLVKERAGQRVLSAGIDARFLQTAFGRTMRQLNL